MIKEALGDRFLLSSVGLFLVASLLFGYFIYEDSAIGLAFGQPLTDKQKSRAIAIALGNPLVMSDIQSLVLWPNGNGTYLVKGVLPPSPVLEIGPNGERNRSLPAVVFVAGNESEKGQNLLVFVDLLQDRVVYIKHAKRADLYGQEPPENYFDVSIAWTGHHDGENLTTGQKAKAVRLAREDKTVKEQMGGRNYSVDGDVIVTNCGVHRNNRSYIGAYPYVRFTQGTPMDQADFQVFVVVDVDRNKVLASMVGVRTPVIDWPGNTS